MSLVNLAHVCSHLQNASLARLGLTSIPHTRLHLSVALLLQKQGFFSQVKLGGPSPPASCFPPGLRDDGKMTAHPHTRSLGVEKDRETALSRMVMQRATPEQLIAEGFNEVDVQWASLYATRTPAQLQEEGVPVEHETFPEEHVDLNFFEFPHGQLTPTHETVITVEEDDKYLLTHFLDKVIKLVFPILDTNQHGSARSDVVLPALESNKAYLHCCLSIAATHMKATEGRTGEQIDNDIVRHRYSAVSELCEALGQDTNHDRILEATLGMIFFQCSVGRPDDALPDIPWHHHFQAAASLVNKLEYPSTMVDLSMTGAAHPPFNMTLTAWIDILGATMAGRMPVFADTYRELNLNHGSAGLAELMGCDDKIMFLISEIACLDLQRSEGLDDMLLCKYVEILATEIGSSEPAIGSAVDTCFSPTGAIRPKQLRINLTAVFRLAARIYLCTLVPGYEPRSPSVCHLLAQFAELMNYIPEGPDGFDRSLAWPLLIAGSCATANTPFRFMFADRSSKLGEAAAFGSFGRVREILGTVWQINDAAAERGDFHGVQWREVMRENKWDFLLI